MLSRWPARKRFPSLRSLQVRERSRQQQTWQEQLAIVERWNAAAGGEVVTVTKDG